MFKVGEYVECVENYGNRLTKGKQYRVDGINGPYYRVIGDDGVPDGWREGWFVAVAGPVRTVTRREIVPGVYGRLRVNDEGKGGRVGLWLEGHYLNADELDSLAMVASQLAEALRDVD